MASDSQEDVDGDVRDDLRAIYEGRFPKEDAAHQQWRQGLWQILVDDYFSRWIDRDGTVDVVFCSNLLEHLPDRETVTRLLREFERMLTPTGRLLILGPNLRYTGSAYWDFFDHILPITDKSLVEALATAALVPETLIPRFLPYTTVGSRLVPLGFVRAYLRIPLAWRFLGAQFFAVSRRKVAGS